MNSVWVVYCKNKENGSVAIIGVYTDEAKAITTKAFMKEVIATHVENLSDSEVDYREVRPNETLTDFIIW